MLTTESIISTPWDAKVLGIDTFEILEPSEENFQQALKKPGHYTVKVDPLSSKEILHKYGFYYCDTLIVPYCRKEKLISYPHASVSLGQDASFEALIPIVPHAFMQGRFHRDFQVPNAKADERYIQWLKQLYDSRSILVLKFNNAIAGFFAHSQNKILLHALKEEFRGRGLAKYFWSAACREMFAAGLPEIQSSISPASVPALNLYVSLGFRFRNPVDVYHRLVKPLG
jgi:hypothetical protein